MSQELKSQIKTIKISKSRLSRIPNDLVLKLLLTKELERNDLLFVAKASDPIYQKFPNLVIHNKLNMLSNTNRTTAKYTEGTTTVEVTSDSTTELLGQQNYDTVLNAVSSVFNQTLKVEAIMALLKKGKVNQVEAICDRSKTIDRFSQTDESCITKVKKFTRRRQQRCKAYAVLDNLLPPETVEKEPAKCKPSENVQKVDLIDTKEFLNEDSNMSDISYDNISLKSWQVPDSVLNVQQCFDIIENCTQEPLLFQLKLIDGSIVTLKTKPQDVFHIATPDNLKYLSVEEQKRLLFHQAYLHWKFCMVVDEDNNLPLHIAVLENNPDLLYRHGLFLVSRQESIDVPGESDLSALQIAVLKNYPKCMNILLSFGASVCQIDGECQTPLHTAAETSLECVQEILEHCNKRPRKILSEQDDLWTPEIECKSDEEKSKYLINKLSSMFDDHGFTPLMLASAKGLDTIVDELLQAAPNTVNLKSPSSGNTALHMAASAVSSLVERKLSPNCLNTIAILCKYGADPNIPNDSGNTVTMLLNEFKSNEVAQILANKFIDGTKKFDSYILVKDDGDLRIEPVKTTKQRERLDANECKEQNIVTETNEDRGNNSKIEPNKRMDTEKVVILDNAAMSSFCSDDIKLLPNCQPVVLNLRDISKKTDMATVRLVNPKTLKIYKPKIQTKNTTECTDNNLSVHKCIVRKYIKNTQKGTESLIGKDNLKPQNVIRTENFLVDKANTKVINRKRKLSGAKMK